MQSYPGDAACLGKPCVRLEAASATVQGPERGRRAICLLVASVSSAVAGEEPAQETCSGIWQAWQQQPEHLREPIPACQIRV